MNNKLKYATCALLTTLMLVSMLLVTFPIGSYAQTPISFIGTEEIIFSSTTEMTIKSPETMQFWSGEQMAFGSTITIQFREAQPDGLLQPSDIIIIISGPIHCPANGGKS